MSARPDVRLRVLTRDREGVLAALGDGEAHIGVLPLEVIPDGITATKLWRSGQMLVVPRGHALARPLPELASLDYYVAQRTGLELSKPALDVKAMIRDLARS